MTEMGIGCCELPGVQYLPEIGVKTISGVASHIHGLSGHEAPLSVLQFLGSWVPGRMISDTINFFAECTVANTNPLE